jgi:ribosomal protein L32
VPTFYTLLHLLFSAATTNSHIMCIQCSHYKLPHNVYSVQPLQTPTYCVFSAATTNSHILCIQCSHYKLPHTAYSVQPLQTPTYCVFSAATTNSHILCIQCSHYKLPHTVVFLFTSFYSWCNATLRWMLICTQLFCKKEKETTALLL